MRKKIPQLYMEKRPSSCPVPPAHPIESLHFCLKNSVCHQQKTLTHRVFVMKINHRDRQPSRPRLQGTVINLVSVIRDVESSYTECEQNVLLHIQLRRKETHRYRK